MALCEDALRLLGARFGLAKGDSLVSVPGRVNLIGEHIDYQDLPVLPMAIQRRICIAFRPRFDGHIRAISSERYGQREFALGTSLEPGLSGDWLNYLEAAVEAARRRWKLVRGIDAAITSDLPPAAGLSSSSALLAGFTLALLHVNEVRPSFEDLMEVLPEGEQFVGTRGGGMDHAAILASKAGCALLVSFAPVEVSPLPIPKDWAFLIAHSLTTAEKSGAVRSEYNSRRAAGSRALEKLGFQSYRSAIETLSLQELTVSASNGRLNEDEAHAFLHVVHESTRVRDAVAALHNEDAETFGKLLMASHGSLRDLLRVSNPPLDSLVNIARESGALGARLTGGGFGGCVVLLCKAPDRDRVRAELVNRYYSHQTDFDPENHLILAEPSAGALHE